MQKRSVLAIIFLVLGSQCGCAILGDLFGVREQQYDSIDRAAESPSARIQAEAAAARQELGQIYN